jgi:hypothetical protein
MDQQILRPAAGGAGSIEFDAEWYAARYPDVALMGMSPQEHFRRIGVRLGRQSVRPNTGTVFAPPPSASATMPARAAAARPAAAGHGAPVDDLRAMLGPEVRDRVQASGLFDERYYAAQYGARAQFGSDLLADCVQAMVTQDWRDPHPLFDCRDYLERHPDVTGMHPLLHYVLYGAAEGRSPFAAAKVNRFFDAAQHSAPIELASLFDGYEAVDILHWEDGNFFFRDIALYTCAFLRDMGLDARVATRTPPARAGTVRLVVAPHEYCVYGDGQRWTPAEAAQAIYFNTEQWDTKWFALAFDHLRRSIAGLIDINPSSAAALRHLGLRCAFLPLLPLAGSCYAVPDQPLSPHVAAHKHVEPLTYSADLADRPYDLLFVGVRNARRGRVLASLAPTLSAWNTFLHCPRFERPVQADDADMLSASDLVQLARNSRLLLNIHQGESHYLEWQRIFLVGMMEGCVTLSEPCTANPVIRPGDHYVECDAAAMPRMIDFLLGTDRGDRMLRAIQSNNADLRRAILAGKRTF